MIQVSRIMYSAQCAALFPTQILTHLFRPAPVVYLKHLCGPHC